MEHHILTKEEVLPLLSDNSETALIFWLRAKHATFFVCFACYTVNEYSGEMALKQVEADGWRETEVGWMCKCCIHPEECAE